MRSACGKKMEFEIKSRQYLITNLSSRATSSRAPVISRRRPELSPSSCSACYHRYIVNHCACWGKKTRKREMCVLFLFLFVNGFTKLCFNKLLETVRFVNVSFVHFVNKKKRKMFPIFFTLQIKQTRYYTSRTTSHAVTSPYS